MARRRRKQKRRTGSLRSLADILDGAYPGRTQDRTLIRTFSWWERAVSRRIAEAARPVQLKHGTLVIHTQSSSWAQELSFLQDDLLASVQKVAPMVKRMRIRVGPMPPPGQPPDPPPPKVRPLDVSLLPANIARALAHVGDDHLRDVLSAAARMSLGAAAPKPEPDETT